MNIEKELRKLARSDYWQALYNAGKENVNLQLFTNISDLSGPQVQFLQWLQIYNMLYTELAQKESIFLTENVINDDERCNAYLYCRRKRIEADWAKHQKERKISEAEQTHKFKNPGQVQVIDVDLRSV